MIKKRETRYIDLNIQIFNISLKLCLIIHYIAILLLKTIIIPRKSLKRLRPTVRIIDLLLFIASTKYLFKKYVGINDCNNNIKQASKAINILQKYLVKNESRFLQPNNILGEDEKHEIDNDFEVEIPESLYNDIFVNDLSIDWSEPRFTSKHMKLFAQNFEVIKRLILEEDKSI
jgi:hypothetical protein